MKLDKNKYSFKVMEGMVKHTRGDEVNPSLPYVRSCASSKPFLYKGPNREIGQSPVMFFMCLIIAHMTEQKDDEKIETIKVNVQKFRSHKK